MTRAESGPRAAGALAGAIGEGHAPRVVRGEVRHAQLDHFARANEQTGLS